MTAHVTNRARKSIRLGLVGSGSLLAAAAFVSLGSGTASAEITEVGPSPTVTSRQATVVSELAIRPNDYGVARGLSETRLADAGVIHAQGEVRDATKAVVGGPAAAFEGAYPTGPAIGDW
ncbi:hypothetical protein [Mycolicibacterium sp.]|uniref:hypothetical protein n=1 Tax=Mycolicibacterium sp. TaxID=2320850 RepID=UPI003D0E58FB